MATIDSPDIIAGIIAANGLQYEDEPPVVKIVSYTNAWGNTVYGVVWEGEPQQNRYDYASPPFINNPIVMWKRKV